MQKESANFIPRSAFHVPHSSTPLLFNGCEKALDSAGIYKGRSCFLVCGGPSFGKLDHAKLRQPGLLTMGVNNSPKTFRPNLWACGDNADHFLRSIWLDPAIMKLAPFDLRDSRIFNSDTWEYLETKVSNCPNVLFYKRHLGFSPDSFLTTETCCWGNDTARGGARSVMLIALRLLHYLGIRRVFLLGCDFTMSGDHAYHFDQQRTGDLVRGNNIAYDVLSKRFAQLRPIFDAAGFQVLNCNKESQLNAFDKIGFDDAVKLALAEWGNIDVAKERSAGLYERVEGSARSSATKTYKPGFTVITCTRNRPEAFKLLERWMARQTQKWNQWIVVNDGNQAYEYTLGQEVVTRVPKQGEGHSLAANLLSAIPRVRHEYVVFAEDDDWLGPKYLESMSAALKKAPLAGSIPALCYNVAARRWRDMGNKTHASLGQTAVRAEALPLLTKIAQRGSPWIDIALWREWSRARKLVPSAGLHVAIKGMPGERGIGIGHDQNFGQPDTKPNLGTLRSWIGVDADQYCGEKKPASDEPAGRMTACIITCHNYGRYLSQCIESCLSQTKPFSEIVVVDDASTDETRSLVQDYPVRYLRVEALDACAARNAGALATESELLLFVDADNWLPDNYHEKLLAKMSGEKVAAVYPAICVHEAGRPDRMAIAPRGFCRAGLTSINPADTCSLIRRVALRTVNYWTERKPNGFHDWNLWLKLERAGWELVFQKEAILQYRSHAASLSQHKKDVHSRYLEAMRDGAMVCIVTIFAGRQKLLANYVQWLQSCTTLWNRSGIHLVAIDNSCSESFGSALLQRIASLGVPFSYVKDTSRGVAHLTSEELGRPENRSHVISLADHVAQLYSRAGEHIPAGARFIFTIEDDVLPPEHALPTLLEPFREIHDLGSVGAAIRSRQHHKLLAWQNCRPVDPQSLTKPMLVDKIGWGCTLIRRDAWNAVPKFFQQTAKYIEGADWTFSDGIRRLGYKIMLRHDVRCRHYESNGTYI